MVHQRPIIPPMGGVTILRPDPSTELVLNECEGIGDTAADFRSGLLSFILAYGMDGPSKEVGLIEVPSIICVNPKKSSFYFGAVALMLKVQGYSWTVSSSS
jgi:hypothetical protein